MNNILKRSLFVGQNHQSSEKWSHRAGWTSALEVRGAIGKTYSIPTYFNNRYTRRILHLGINKLYCDLIDQSSRLLLSSPYYSRYLNSHTLWRPSQHTCTRPLHKKTYMEEQRSGFLDHLRPQPIKRMPIEVLCVDSRDFGNSLQWSCPVHVCILGTWPGALPESQHHTILNSRTQFIT